MSQDESDFIFSLAPINRLLFESNHFLSGSKCVNTFPMKWNFLIQIATNKKKHLDNLFTIDFHGVGHLYLRGALFHSSTFQFHSQMFRVFRNNEKKPSHPNCSIRRRDWRKTETSTRIRRDQRIWKKKKEIK